MFIEEISQSECFSVLSPVRLGRLACSRENQPYVVPIYFAFGKSADGEPYLYGCTTPGQKVEWMRANPLVCVEVDDIANFDSWTSIVIFGRYEELPDFEEESTRAPIRATPMQGPSATSQERERAHALLEKHASWWQPGYAAYLARAGHSDQEHYRLVYYRIRIDRITGHRATPRDLFAQSEQRP